MRRDDKSNGILMSLGRTLGSAGAEGHFDDQQNPFIMIKYHVSTQWENIVTLSKKISQNDQEMVILKMNYKNSVLDMN